MSLPISLPSFPLKVEDYCAEFTSDPTPAIDQATEFDRHRRPSVSSAGTIPSPVSPTFPQSSQDEPDDCWNLIPYNVPWGNNYHNYEYGTLPGPQGACIFLRSPTPVKNQRTSQACKKCRERKAKCSGTRPSCERCLARGHACVYVDDPKRVRRSVSNASLCHRSHHPESRSVSRRASYQSFLAESTLDHVHCSSPHSPVLSVLQLEQDSEPDFSAALELGHEDSYDREFSSAIQLSEPSCVLPVQSAPSNQSSNPLAASFHSPQPMRYPQLEPLLSISIPGTDEIPALESTSSSPASTSSQSTPLLDYQPGMLDHTFAAGEFGSNNFQSYCVPQSVQYPQFSQASMAMPMGCSFENSHQVYTMGDSGEHLTSTEGFPHPYNEEFLVRPQFVPY